MQSLFETVALQHEPRNCDMFQESKYAVKPRNVDFHLMKKDKDDEYWPRLLKDKVKEKAHVRIDWNRYVDEDEENEGFDTSNMDGMVRPEFDEH